MSHKSGDRARADKRAKKRRVRRAALRPLRKAINASQPRVSIVPAPGEAPAENS